MPKQISYRLSSEAVKAIQQAMKSQDSWVARRATMVYGLHSGQPPSAVARLHHVVLATVYATWERYQRGGIEGLKNRPRSGRPSKVTDEYRVQLETLMNQSPTVFGYAFAIWTADRLRLHLEQVTGISLSEATLLKTLEGLGYVYRRPKTDLTQRQDAADRQAFQDRLDTLKRGRKQALSGFSLWMKADSA